MNNTDQEILDAVATLGVAGAARALGYSAPGSLSGRLKRIRKTGAGNAYKTPQQDLLADAGTRENPHRFRQGNSIQELYDNHAVVPENVEIVDGRIREHGAVITNKKTGEQHIEVSYFKSSGFKPKKGTPKFPLIQPAEPTSFSYAPAGVRGNTKYVVVVSDAQIGYLRNPKTGGISPTHDPRAIEVCRQVIANLAPTKVIGIGDWMDWPAFSRFVKHPEYFGVTQQSVQTGYEWLGRLIAAAPEDCEHWMIGSNHQLRPEKFVMEFNREASYLTRAKAASETGEEWPVFSEQFLLRYDELGVRFSGQYPGGELEFLPDYWAMHAPPKVREFAGNVVNGHMHKATIGHNVIHGRKRSSYTVTDTGCLCAVGQNEDSRSLHVLKTPSGSGRTDWAQGITVIEYAEGSTHYQTYLVNIENGKARFMGVEYDGTGVVEDWLDEKES